MGLKFHQVVAWLAEHVDQHARDNEQTTQQSREQVFIDLESEVEAELEHKDYSVYAHEEGPEHDE